MNLDRKTIILAAVGLFVLIGSIILLNISKPATTKPSAGITTPTPTAKNSADTTAKTGSGDNAGNDNNTGGADTPAADSGKPVQTQFEGLNSFLDQGAGADQVNGFKFAVFKFLKARGKSGASKITVENAEHTHSLGVDGAAIDSITFDLTIDGGKYRGNLNTSDLDFIQLTVRDAKSNEEIYYSSDVNVNDGSGR